MFGTPSSVGSRTQGLPYGLPRTRTPRNPTARVTYKGTFLGTGTTGPKKHTTVTCPRDWYSTTVTSWRMSGGRRRTLQTRGPLEDEGGHQTSAGRKAACFGRNAQRKQIFSEAKKKNLRFRLFPCKVNPPSTPRPGIVGQKRQVCIPALLPGFDAGHGGGRVKGG